MTGCAHDSELERAEYLKPDYSDNLIDISIDLVAAEDGSALTPGGNGFAVVSFTNKSGEDICLPLFWDYGKGGQKDLEPSYKSYDFYAGFETADVTYSFIGPEGDIVLEDNVSISPSEVNLGPDGSVRHAFRIKAPDEAGTYSFRLSFDNRKLEKPINSYNFVIASSKFNLFRKDVIIEGVSVIDR